MIEQHVTVRLLRDCHTGLGLLRKGQLLKGKYIHIDGDIPYLIPVHGRNKIWLHNTARRPKFKILGPLDLLAETAE